MVESLECVHPWATPPSQLLGLVFVNSRKGGWVVSIDSIHSGLGGDNFGFSRETWVTCGRQLQHILLRKTLPGFLAVSLAACQNSSSN